MSQAQQRQQGRGGGFQRRDQAPAPRTENQQLSDQAKRQAASRELLTNIERMRMEITAVLPSSMTFDAFRTTVLIAIRSNPDILSCTMASIITACMKSAWDGLPPDGRLAALIPSNNKYKDSGNREYWLREARYNPMVAGLRSQILKGGLVDDLQTVIVYANEVAQNRFKMTRGANPNIEHEPIVIDSERGPPVGCYSAAWLKNGRFSPEYMTERQILDVKEASQSGPVWKGKFDLEMWRKTVLRRHRKALPGCNDIVDVEAHELFPDFAGATPIPAAVTAQPSRPTRADFAAIEHQPDNSFNDFGGMDLGGGAMTEEEMEAEERGLREKIDPPTEQKRSAETPASPDGALGPNQPMPETAEAWEQWADRVKTAIAKAADTDQVNALRREQQSFIEKAPQPLAEEVNEAFFDVIEKLTNPNGGGNGKA